MIQKRLGLLVVFFFWAVAVSPVSGEAMLPSENNSPLHFTHPLDLGMEVYSMLQDREGFLWIVTARSGLAKFDGRDVRFLGGGAGRLSTSAVVAAREGPDGLLWVATAGGGLNVYDKATETVRYLLHDKKDPGSLISNTFSYRNHSNQVLLFDHRGKLWCGTDRGLDRLEHLDPMKSSFAHISRKDGRSTTIHALLEDREGMLWVGTDRGLACVEGDFLEPVAEGKDGPLEGGAVFSLLEDRDGTLWIGGTTGLHRRDRKTGIYRHYHNGPAGGSKNSALPEMMVASLFEAEDGGIFLGSTFGPPGLWRFDPVTEQCTLYRHDPENVRSLGASSLGVRSVFRDRTGNLWILHGSGKADVGSSHSGPFRVWKRSQEEEKMGLSESVAGGVHRDPNGVLWFASFGGLDRYDPDTGTFQHFRSEPGNPTTLPHRSATALAVDRKNRLWIGTMGGVSLFDRMTRLVVGHIPAPAVYAICPDPRSDDILWLGTLDQGLFRVDLATRTLRRIDPLLSSDEERRVHGKVWAVVPDGRNKEVLWLPTMGGGLDRFDTGTESWEHFHAGAPGLVSDRLAAVREDRFGRFWVATEEAGLLSFDRSSGQFFPVPLGGGGDVPRHIRSLEEDEGGRIWMGTDVGLWCFDPTTGSVRAFTVSDGLPGNDFIPRSARTDDGVLWFMTMEGVVSFLPTSLGANPTPPPVYLTALTRGGMPFPLKSAPERVQEIVLQWPENAFEFEFAALNYVLPEKNRYAYKMDGVDHAWFHSGSRGFGRYAGLPGGAYVLRMKGTNNDGVWSTEEAVLRVVVIPPPWATWWFQSAVVGFLLVGTILLFRWRSRRARAYQYGLALRVRKRTAQLAAANERLRREVTERSRAEETLRRITVTDELTGLYNRRGFFEKAAHVLALGKRHSKRVFLLYADVDNFKGINDAFGHAEGDEALREIGLLFRNAFRNSDVLARLGGDEFVVLGLLEEGEKMPLRRLREHLARRNLGSFRSYTLDLSVGFSVAPGEQAGIDALLREADSAMYREKVSRRLRRMLPEEEKERPDEGTLGVSEGR